MNARTYIGQFPDDPYYITAEEEAELEANADDRQLEAYEAAMADLMTGAGPFWIADGEQHAEWDCEQEFAIARACRDALRNSKLTNGERWHLVMDTILEEGAKCAEHTAERAR